MKAKRRLTITQVKHLVSRADEILRKAQGKAEADWITKHPEPQVPNNPKRTTFHDYWADTTGTIEIITRKELKALVEAQREQYHGSSNWHAPSISTDDLIRQTPGVRKLLKLQAQAKANHRKWKEKRENHHEKLNATRKQQKKALEDTAILSTDDMALELLEALKSFKF